MTKVHSRKLAGLCFVVVPLLVNIPYGLLMAHFDYPDILRRPAGEILLRFYEGGPPLIWTWWAFGVLGLPLFYALIVLHEMLRREDTHYLPTATTFGILSLVAQLVGLLRWTFVVPVLAGIIADPSADGPTKQAAVVSFQTLHQFGGVLLGEHLGQLFTVLWMFMVGFAMQKSQSFRPWLGWFGIASGVVYLLAQLELFATVISTLPVVRLAGLVGSMLWLVWMVLIGITILRAKAE